MSKRTRIRTDGEPQDGAGKDGDARPKQPAKGSDLLKRSQADRMILDYEGRPKDSGAMLEALKREHPERDPSPGPLLGQEREP